MNTGWNSVKYQIVQLDFTMLGTIQLNLFILIPMILTPSQRIKKNESNVHHPNGSQTNDDDDDEDMNE